LLDALVAIQEVRQVYRGRLGEDNTYKWVLPKRRRRGWGLCSRLTESRGWDYLLSWYQEQQHLQPLPLVNSFEEKFPISLCSCQGCDPAIHCGSSYLLLLVGAHRHCWNVSWLRHLQRWAIPQVFGDY